MPTLGEFDLTAPWQLHPQVALRPEPFGAHRITSTFSGGTTCVWSLYTIEKPCEKYSVLPGVTYSFRCGHVDVCAASDSRFMRIVPFVAASSIENRFLPGTQPSASAWRHDSPSLRTPTITFRPLSRKFSPWPWPCEP